MKIMVITKNILSETAFQHRLQHLDHSQRNDSSQRTIFISKGISQS